MVWLGDTAILIVEALGWVDNVVIPSVSKDGCTVELDVSKAPGTELKSKALSVLVILSRSGNTDDEL